MVLRAPLWAGSGCGQTVWAEGARREGARSGIESPSIYPSPAVMSTQHNLEGLRAFSSCTGVSWSPGGCIPGGAHGWPAQGVLPARPMHPNCQHLHCMHVLPGAAALGCCSHCESQHETTWCHRAELFKKPLDEDEVVEQEVSEHDGLQYYFWTLQKPYRLVSPPCCASLFFCLFRPPCGAAWSQRA